MWAFPFTTRQVIIPEDPTFGTGLRELVHRLWGVGVEHFCASRSVGGRVRTLLHEGRPAGFGFITTVDEIASGGWKCPPVPTAVLLPPMPSDLALFWESMNTWGGLAANQMLIVASPTHTVGGRRLLDIASIQGALREEILDELAIRRSVT